MLTTTAIDIAGHQISVHYDTQPDECPVCHRGIAAIGGSAFVSARTDSYAWTGKLELLYRCPREDCARAFIAVYDQVIQNPRGDRTFFFLNSLTPSTFQAPVVDSDISRTSPNFVKIYGQALAAEHLKLDEICGCGFRRAVEFLIKDYLIERRPAETESIKKASLATCINNYVSDAKTKTCAQRATWLGNDQTHYERQYTQHDITCLKELIRLTTYWIASEILTAKYETEIAKK